jgi:hypothetical protein
VLEQLQKVAVLEEVVESSFQALVLEAASGEPVAAPHMDFEAALAGMERSAAGVVQEAV